VFQLPADKIIDLIGLWLGRIGYPLVFINALAENIAIVNYFTPGSTVVWVAGLYARLGTMNPILVWLLATVGAVIGNQIDYLVGYTGGYHLIRTFKVEKQVEEQKQRYVRRGNIVEAFIIYLVGHLRSFLLIALGALRVSWPNYLAFTAASAAIRKGIFVSIGYFLGTNRPFIEWFLANFWWTGIALLLLWILIKRIAAKCGYTAPTEPRRRKKGT